MFNGYKRRRKQVADIFSKGSVRDNKSKDAYPEPISLTDFTLTRKTKQDDNVRERTFKNENSNSLVHKSSKKHCETYTRRSLHSTHTDPSSFVNTPFPVPRASPKGGLSFPPHKIIHTNKNQEPSFTSNATQDDITGRGKEVTTDVKSKQSDGPCPSIAVDAPLPVLKSEHLEECFNCGDEDERDSLMYSTWRQESDEEENANVDFSEVSQDERCFVCPRGFQKVMDGFAHTLVHEEHAKSSNAVCQPSLSLVYITMQVNYQEGTLQLLSDLLHLCYCPPKDVMSHLLSDILLDPLCPQHRCVQACNLLMRAQRHQSVDKNSVAWSWELVTSVMSNQDDEKRHRPEVVRMFLEYVVQTLEDDFSNKKSTSEFHHSIAKTMLSCTQHFPQVRDVIQWMFSTIVKSTGNGESGEAVREREEHIKIVSSLQRMLSLAVEVDRSPALSAPKLTQELSFMLVSTELNRAHRLLLLDSMRNNMLRYKLLEHLLDDSCPLKTPMPMSLSRLLYFVENCTLAADPTDGSESWKKWEELVHHLWMLLFSYNTAMKEYLNSAVSKPTGATVYKPEDVLTKADICKTLEVFLCRAKADVGQALPLHVEESLFYLQDLLLEVYCPS
ncbi:SUMO-interacting motif-containing protein 1 isoform X2 [Entelurus aequoreus]|uniref:SUMO-interacting motif-containing protein 1 isoform X2 n=1 Tax=Entelurus aequoreus TaxID=161455 RepID=UPI002B1DE4A2|nr:SUMO-interacting motif-containing protein 1 isoform X2 [Entelurus aequoreus]